MNPCAKFFGTKNCFLFSADKTIPNHFKEAGIDCQFEQDNQSASKKGVLRGLHFQINHPQDKLVRVVNGEVFDVADKTIPNHFPNVSEPSLKSTDYGKYLVEVAKGLSKKQIVRINNYGKN